MISILVEAITVSNWLWVVDLWYTIFLKVFLLLSIVGFLWQLAICAAAFDNLLPVSYETFLNLISAVFRHHRLVSLLLCLAVSCCLQKTY